MVGGGYSPDLKRIAIEQEAEALDMLDVDYESMPGWFSPRLTNELGVFLPGDLVLVGARPGCGKTTLLTTQAAYLVQAGHRVIYAGMEMRPARLKVELAAARLGYDKAAVVRGQWRNLPTGARYKLEEELRRFRREWQDRLVFVDDERVTLSRLQDWAEVAGRDGFDFIVIDHIHRMDWGNPHDLTASMNEGAKVIKTMAKENGLRVLAAVQLKRANQYDPLEEYMVPPLSAIKQCGAFEEEADVVLMLHRALRAKATEGDLVLVRRGQLNVSEVAEFGTMSVHISKSRLDGAAKDQEIRLYVGRGRLYDDANERDRRTFE